jgi:hypothetical protein
MSVVFISYSLCYYYLFIRFDDDTDINNSAAFWWVAGTLLFYYGSTAVELFFTIINVRSARLFGYRHLIFIFLNVIQYSFWSYSFLCRYRQQK